MILTGGNTYRGDTHIYGGTLQVGDNVSTTAGLIGTNYVWVGAGTEFNLRPSPTEVMTIKGTVDVVGSARLQGPGTVRFGGLGMGGSVDLGSCLLEVGSNNETTAFSGIISDGGLGGSLTKVGTGTLMLSGANAYQGTTTVNAGTLQVRPTGSIAGSSHIVVGDWGRLLLESSAPLASDANVSSSGQITFSNSSAGNATFALLPNHASGAGASQLNFNGTSNAGSATITASTEFGNGASVYFNNTSRAGSAAIHIDGDYAGLVFRDDSKAEQAQLTASGFSVIHFEGTATGNSASVNLVDTDTWLVASESALSSLSLGSLEGAGQLFLGARTLYVGSNHRNTLFSGIISDNATGGGIVTKTGTGVLSLRGNNAFGGSLAIQGGLVNFAGVPNLGTGSQIVLDGGGLQWAAGSAADISVRNAYFAAGGATLDTQNNNVALAHAIGGGGSGSLTKRGNGRLTLYGDNQYTGGTIVAEGVLAIGGVGSIHRSSAIIVQPGALLDISGVAADSYTLSNGQIMRNDGAVNTGERTLVGGFGSTYCGVGTIQDLRMEPGSFYRPGMSTGINQVTGDLFLNGNLSVFELFSKTDHDMTKIGVQGTLTLTNQALLQLVFLRGGLPEYGQYTLFQNAGMANYGQGFWLVDPYYENVPTQLLEDTVYYVAGEVPVAFTIGYSGGASGRDIMIVIPEPGLPWMVIPAFAIWTLRRRREGYRESE